jgi:sugar diacid utilization regulator
MRLHEKTLIIIGTTGVIVAAHNPMTVRQLHYQFVFRLQSKAGAIIAIRRKKILEVRAPRDKS